ncbi:MAG: bifunctional folylpolyglutamate synthase/dihydrofolate synthase [Candidatus Aminicenantes bacterium]|nr:bifunctional folylpolyglutamate synthase/dihydrofolate synthase [Candidatus Aminicenantes bacterium]
MNRAQSQAYLGHLEKFGIRLGLDAIREILAGLGNPQDRFSSVLVAGTNGKGSVCAMLAEILAGHGWRVGLYTSPHLVRVEERIQVDRKLIPARALGRLLGRVRETNKALLAAGRLAAEPTFFEVLTAAAFLHFAARRVDIAVLEVGLGGRFDATNVVRPLATAITSIGHDHQQYLGRTLGRIAFEKAGILKPGVPVVCGERSGSTAYAVIRKRAEALEAPLLGVFDGGRLEPADGRGRFVFRRAGRTYRFTPSLPGRHQGENAAVAILVAEELSRSWRPLKKARVIAGVERARWEGRLETVSVRPPVILDGAHNEEGAAALAAHLRRIFKERIILVFGVLCDKDIRAMARRLFPLADMVVLTRIPNDRSAEPAAVAALAPRFRGRLRVEPDPRRAVRLAQRESAGRTPVVIAGSLFLVGEVKRLRLFPA